MAEEVKLVVDIREDFSGKGKNQLRREGKIPAILYGKGIKSTPVIIDEKEFKEAVSTEHGENVLMKLKIGTKKAVTALIKEIQTHPVTMKILHVDLCKISLTDAIEVEVPLEVKGEAPGVKSEGGVLEHLIRHVRVKCLPTEIPDKLLLDVSGLGIGDGLKIKDIQAVKGVEILEDGESLAIYVVAPTELKEPEEVVEEAEAEPEVIGKKVKEEEGEEAES